jgi:hypothetical protein
MIEEVAHINLPRNIKMHPKWNHSMIRNKIRIILRNERGSERISVLVRSQLNNGLKQTTKLANKIKRVSKL